MFDEEVFYHCYALACFRFLHCQMMATMVAAVPIIIPAASHAPQLACLVVVLSSCWVLFKSVEEFLVFFDFSLFVLILVVFVTAVSPLTFAPGFASSVCVSTPFDHVAVDLYRSVSSTDVVSFVTLSLLVAGISTSTGTSCWLTLVVSWVSMMVVSFSCSTLEMFSCWVIVSVSITFFLVAHPAKRLQMQRIIRM